MLPYVLVFKLDSNSCNCQNDLQYNTAMAFLNHPKFSSFSKNVNELKWFSINITDYYVKADLRINENEYCRCTHWCKLSIDIPTIDLV